MKRRTLVWGLAALGAAFAFLPVAAMGAGPDSGVSAKKRVTLRVVVLGLQGQGKPMVTASQIS